MQIEKRIFNTNLELRAAEDGSPERIVGHAAVFGKRSVDLGGFTEEIERGAFSNAISEGDDVRALWNHDANLVMGRTPTTLRLAEDKDGLRVEIDLEGAPDHVRDLTKSIKRGDVSQMSFAFSLRSADGDSWHEEDGGAMVRTLKDLRLFDVSPVTYPAYPDTSVAARSLDHYKELHAEVTAQVAELIERDTLTVDQARVVATLRHHGLELP